MLNAWLMRATSDRLMLLALDLNTWALRKGRGDSASPSRSFWGDIMGHELDAWAEGWSVHPGIWLMNAWFCCIWVYLHLGSWDMPSEWDQAHSIQPKSILCQLSINLYIIQSRKGTRGFSINPISPSSQKDESFYRWAFLVPSSKQSLIKSSAKGYSLSSSSKHSIIHSSAKGSIWSINQSIHPERILFASGK